MSPALEEKAQVERLLTRVGVHARDIDQLARDVADIRDRINGLAEAVDTLRNENRNARATIWVRVEALENFRIEVNDRLDGIWREIDRP